MITDKEKLPFFINLHNFLILFALCKDGKKPIPKTLLEWLNYKAEIAINVGRHSFTALEIEHAILRAHMCVPKIPSPYSDTLPYFVKFGPNDHRARFRFSRKEKYVNFAFFLPTM